SVFTCSERTSFTISMASFSFIVDGRWRTFRSRRADGFIPLELQARHISRIDDILRSILPQVGYTEAEVIPGGIHSHSCVIGGMAYLPTRYDGMETRSSFCRNGNCLSYIAMPIGSYSR